MEICVPGKAKFFFSCCISVLSWKQKSSEEKPFTTALGNYAFLFSSMPTIRKSPVKDKDTIADALIYSKASSLTFFISLYIPVCLMSSLFFLPLFLLSVKVNFKVDCIFLTTVTKRTLQNLLLRS